MAHLLAMSEADYLWFLSTNGIEPTPAGVTRPLYWRLLYLLWQEPPESPVGKAVALLSTDPIFDRVPRS